MQMYFVSYRMLCDLIHVRSNIQFYFNIRYIRNLYFRIRILIGHMSISAQIPRSGTCNTLFPVRRTVNKIKGNRAIIVSPLASPSSPAANTSWRSERVAAEQNMAS